MPTLTGQCVDCGEAVTAYVRPGNQLRCFQCNLGRMAQQHRNFANGTDPSLAKSIQAGHEAASQIRNRKGPAYERWVGGIKAYLDSPDTTE